MKNLQIIQRTTKVFQILSRIAMIFAFVGALLALTAIGAWCCFSTQGNLGSSPVLGFIIDAVDQGGFEATIAQLLFTFVWCMIEGLLLIFVHRYLTAELEDGTPFTEKGAKMAMSLGIKMIVLPIVGAIISAVIGGIYNADLNGYLSNESNAALGIGLILFSLVLRYGAELERKMLSDNILPRKDNGADKEKGGSLEKGD